MRLHHLAFRTPEPLHLAVFYEDVLGLCRVRVQGDYSIWLGLEDAVLMIERRSKGEPPIDPRTRELFALCGEPSFKCSVADRLVERGVAIEATTEHTIYFRDPDGRRVAVSSYPLSEVP